MGRTGAFICLDIVQEQVQKEKVVDITGVINKMRHQRMKMVNLQVCKMYVGASYDLTRPLIIQQEQFIFLHDVILKSTLCGSTEVCTANFKRAVRRWSKHELPGNHTTLGKQFKVSLA